MTIPACSEAARTRTIEFYIAEESTAGTAEVVADTDFVELTADPTLPAPFQKADIQNLSRTTGLDRLPAQVGQVVGQDLVFTTYVYHSASAGAVPHLGQLWKGLTGTETINGGSDVTYTPSSSDNALESFTVLIKTDNLSMQVAAQVTQAVVSMTPTDDDSALLMVEWTMSIYKWYFYTAGKASGTSATSVITFTDAADAARFIVGSIVDLNSGTKATVDAVDRSAGTIDVSADPGDGAVTVAPWSPGAPAAPAFTEFQFLAHEVTFEILTNSGESLEELPMRDMLLTWNNALVTTNNETGRGIGVLCVHRVANREIVNAANTIQYPNQAEWFTAAAENRDITTTITATAADGSTRTFKLSQGTNGEAKIRTTGTSSEDGLMSDSFDITYYDTLGGDDALEIEFA